MYKRPQSTSQKRHTIIARIVAISLTTVGLWGGETGNWQCGGTAPCWISGTNVGIGTSTPSGKLTLGNNAYTAPLGTSYGQFQIILWDGGAANSSFGMGIESYNVGFASNGGYKFYQQAGSSPLMVIGGQGSTNVGIGTTMPQYPLSVNGTIQAKEVLVNTGWSDYVFAPNYRLPGLAEVAAYIKANHHLPDIPSAAEVQQTGVGVGQMESKLLAKVEELTLHMIELDAENRELRARVERMEAEQRLAK